MLYGSKWLFGLAAHGVSVCATTSEKSSKTIQQMSKEELKSRFEDPSLVILDVRRPQDWKKRGKKIKGAVQENPYKFESWYARYPKAKTLLLYCARPNEQTRVSLARRGSRAFTFSRADGMKRSVDWENIGPKKLGECKES